MNFLITTAAIFAQAAEKKAPAAEDGLTIPPWTIWVVLGAMAYFLLYLPSKREKAKRKSLLDGLKKNDKVVTAGGIIGTIASISPDSDEVTVKVDDNTRIRFRRSSIQLIVDTQSDTDKEPAI